MLPATLLPWLLAAASSFLASGARFAGQVSNAADFWPTLWPTQSCQMRPGMAGILKGSGGFCLPDLNAAGVIRCSTKDKPESPTFELLDAGCGSLALRAVSSGKLCSDGGFNGSVSCMEESISFPQRFTVSDGGRGKLPALRGGKSGEWCTGGNTMACNGGARAVEEKAHFTWTCLKNCTITEAQKVAPPALLSGSQVDLSSHHQRSFCMTASITTNALNATILATVFRTRLWIAAERLEGDIWPEDLDDETRRKIEEKRQKSRDAQDKAKKAKEKAEKARKRSDDLYKEAVKSDRGGRQDKAEKQKLKEKSDDAWSEYRQFEMEQEQWLEVAAQFAVPPSADAAAHSGATVLFLCDGFVCFGVAGKTAIRGKTKINDLKLHEVGVLWDKDKGNFTIRVDGKPDGEGLGDALYDEPAQTALVLGIDIKGVSAEMPSGDSVITMTVPKVAYNGQPVDARAFAALPGHAGMPKPVLSTDVDLSCSRTSRRDFALSLRLATNAKDGVIALKAAKKGNKWHSPGPLLGLVLRSGRACFLAGGAAVVQGSKSLNDGREHDLDVFWDGTSLSIQVDGRMDVASKLNASFTDSPSTALVIGERVISASNAVCGEALRGNITDVIYNGSPVMISVHLFSSPASTEPVAGRSSKTSQAKD